MGLTEVLTHLPRLMRLRGELRRRIIEWRPDVFIGVDYKEFNLGLAQQAQARRPRHRAIRESAGVGLAAGAGAHHRRVRGPGVVPVPLRAGFLSRARRARGVRRPSARRPDSAGRGSRRGARRARASIRRARVLAVLPGSRRGEVEKLADVFAGAAELLANAFPGLVSIAPMVTPALRDLFAARCAAHAPDAQRAAARRPGAPRAGGRGRGAGGVGHRDARDRVVQAADGGGLQARRHHGIPAAHARTREDQAFLAAQPARRQGAGAGVLPGSGHARRISRMRWRTGSSIPRKWRGCSRSSPRSMPGCGATARTARRPKWPSCSTTRASAAMKLRVRLRVAGVDEAGRGPLAGPVVAAAVILNPARPIRGLADSKVLEPEERERLAHPDSRAGVVLRRGLGRRRRNRQHQYPAGDHARDAPRFVGPAPCRHSRCSSTAIVVRAPMVWASNACSRR